MDRWITEVWDCYEEVLDVLDDEDVDEEEDVDDEGDVEMVDA